MDLEPGVKLGPYQIIAHIGEGGMGEVWKARDTRLGRDVALKISKSEFTARFEREARTIAALSHPHICPLYDVGPNYLVMELIDGVPLKGPLPVAKAVEYAAQILDALDAAHRKGIIHRDLKPSNMLVTKKGIKLLDFGLAKQTTALQGDAPTVLALSVEGQITGTLQYMSPEQLQGKEADARSDIFSFGCVLYEMLSGKRAFEGASAASVIAAILDREPEPLKTTPPLDRVVRTCMAKDLEDRYQSACDLKRDLLWAVEATPAKTARSSWLPWALATGLAVAFAGYAILNRPAQARETRVDIVTPPTTRPGDFAVSPDGRKIAYVATADGASRLWVRTLDSTSAQPLPGTENATNPFWSPDGRSLGFFADLKLRKVDLGGGQPQTLATVLTPGAYGTWNTEGVILFSVGGNNPLSRVPAAGGKPAPATKFRTGQTAHLVPRFLAGGRQFLFMANGADPAMWLGSLDNPVPRRLFAFVPDTDSAPEYLAAGWLVWVRQNVLLAQRFDAGRGQVSGGLVPLAQAVSVNNALAGSFSVSPSGTIAWRSGRGNLVQLTWFNRSGENLGTLGAPVDNVTLYPELSPDGKKASTTRGHVGSTDVWMQDSTRASRFTIDPADDRFGIWSPDGSRVAFASNRNGTYDLYQKPANGTGNEELLLQSAEPKWPNSWSPDGRFIMYITGTSNGDLMVLPLTGDRKPFPFVATPFNEQQGTFSPDGKWVAYQSSESGRFEIYVRPFPGPGARAQVSAEGGISPRWQGDGKELYYVAPDAKVMAAAARVQGSTFVPGAPVALFQTQIVPQRQTGRNTMSPAMAAS